MNHSFHSIYNIIGVSIFLATQSSAAVERRNPSTSILLQALSSQLSSPGIEEKAEGNGLPRLQIYEYGHLGTGNGAAGLELV